MAPKFFPSPAALRKWFEKHHESEKELLVGFYKVGSGKPSITWSESVDEALCFGWIDGVRRSIDESSYCIRFTPRKPTSTWSAINIKKIAELKSKGLMYPKGEAAFELRREHKSRLYSYENKPKEFEPSLLRIFKSNRKAWTFFTSLPPSYQRTAMFWVMSAKQDATKLKRLNQLVADSESGERIKPLRYGANKKTNNNNSANY